MTPYENIQNNDFTYLIRNFAASRKKLPNNALKSRTFQLFSLVEEQLMSTIN